MKVVGFLFDHVIQLDDGCPTANVVVDDINASADPQEDVQKIKIMIRNHFPEEQCK